MGEDWAEPDDTARGGQRSRPQLLIFDVNETVSNLSPLADRFADVGAPRELAATWFASVLRDGFALTATGTNPTFAEVAAECLRGSLPEQVPDPVAAVEHIMIGFAALPVHDDVVAGVRALGGLGVRLVTLSNGGTAVADGLLQRHGIRDLFEQLLSVEQAPLWKPATAAYDEALRSCTVQASDAMLVAVHPWDIHGAHCAGLATAWVNRADGRYPRHFAAPDLEVTSVVDLAARLGRTPYVHRTADLGLKIDARNVGGVLDLPEQR